MEIALLVGLILILFLEVAASLLIYSYFTYCKNLLFTRTKYSIFLISLFAILAIFFLIASILFCINSSDEQTKFKTAFIVLSFICLTISCVYLVILLIAPKLTNKNKIAYDKILSVDYKTKINTLKQKIGDVDILKNKLSNKNKQYYTSMLSYYETILKRLKDNKISKTEKIADIITFNDSFTHKWSSFLNNYQLLLTLEFCEIFKKIF